MPWVMTWFAAKRENALRKSFNGGEMVSSASVIEIGFLPLDGAALSWVAAGMTVSAFSGVGARTVLVRAPLKVVARSVFFSPLADLTTLSHSALMSARRMNQCQKSRTMLNWVR